MVKEMNEEKLIKEMIEYNSHDPKRIHHLLKVYSFAKTIGLLEGIGEKEQKILEISSILHDIGIRNSERKYGRCDGKLQEKEGPKEAEKMLERLGYDDEIIQRVCYLIGHHHTYSDIDGEDYQILVEADFLVNIYEDNLKKENIETVQKKIFKTKTGIEFLKNMY